MNQKENLARALHAAAAAGPLLFVAVATAEGSFRTDYDPIAEPISALALGPRGWVQVLNFVLLAISFFSFAVMLRAHFRKGPASVAAPSVFGLMTFGALMAGAFVMDAPGAPPTVVGRLHDMAGFLVFPLMPVAALLLARRFRRDAAWRPYFAYTLVTAVLFVATLTFFLLFVGLPSGPPLPASEFRGLIQRGLLLLFFAWMALVSWRAYRATSHRPAAVIAHDASRALS
jgi:hypothetical protein